MIRTFSHTLHKNKHKGIKDLSVRPEIIKLLEEDIDHSNVNHSNICFGLSPQAKAILTSVI